MYIYIYVYCMYVYIYHISIKVYCDSHLLSWTLIEQMAWCLCGDKTFLQSVLTYDGLSP